MERLGLDGIIFHDGLSDTFIQRHQTIKLRFIAVPPAVDLSNNDYRFFVYRDWLPLNPVDSVFCVDLFDVRVNRNPHELLDDSHHLWVGIERDWTIDQRTPDGQWMVNKLRTCYGNVPRKLHGKPILTAGHWGGFYRHVLRFLVRLTSEIDCINPGPKLNCNMAAFNRVMYRDMGARHLWMKGAPLHSVFRTYDTNADVCFVHK